MMTRILGVALAAALAAALVPQTSSPAEAAKKKAKNSANQQGKVQSKNFNDFNFTHMLDKAPPKRGLTGARRQQAK
jgi:hypothetical protein